MHTGPYWYPLESYGFTSSLWRIDISTAKNALITSFVLWIIVFVCYKALQKKNSHLGFALKKIGYSLYDMLTESFKVVNYKVFLFSGSLFTVILFYNLSVLLPFVEEPTKDLNVTVAAALIAVFFIHKESFIYDKEAYLHHWIKTPLSMQTRSSLFIIKNIEWIGRLALNIIISIISFPFELLSRLSSVISLAFRLYGNIFGGATISTLLHAFLSLSWIYQIIGLITGLNIIVMLFFGLLEGTIQAFVFMLVTVNNLAMLQSSEE